VAFDPDDLPKRHPKPLDALEAEKLDALSVEELAYRIKVLSREIARTEAALKEKQASLSDAEKFFRK
jgi:uncharacterized small protein (DUF1192 family)